MQASGATNKMSQRRMIHFLIRGILLCLCIFLLWKMVSEITVKETTQASIEVLIIQLFIYFKESK